MTDTTKNAIQGARQNLSLLENQLLGNLKTVSVANIAAIISSLQTLDTAINAATNVSTL